MKPNYRLLAVSLGVGVLAVLPYLRVGGFELINLDDYPYVVTRPVEGGLTWEGLKWAFGAFGYMGIWMPCTWISYMLDTTLFGGGAGIHHWGNAVLHAMNAILLFLLLRLLLGAVKAGHEGGDADSGKPGHAGYDVQTTRNLLAAALAALFWALHPLRVEPVAWVASRKDVLALFWELLALIFWVKQIVSCGAAHGTEATSCGEGERPTGSTARGRSAKGYWILSMACFALAGMSKPSAMTFPVLAGLLEYLLVRKVRFHALLVPFLMALGIAAIAQQSQASGGATSALAAVPIYARLANAAAAFGTYCWKTVWPSDLAVQYLHPWPAWPRFLWHGSMICVAYGAIMLWCGREALKYLGSEMVKRSGRAKQTDSAPGETHSFCAKDTVSADLGAVVFAGLFWFLITVLPTLGLANFGFHSHADRFTYLPAIGFSLILAFAIRSAASWRGGTMPHLLRVVLPVAAISGYFGVLSWRQAAYWKDDGTLFTRTVEVTGKENYVAQFSLALHAFGMGDTEASLTYFERGYEVAQGKGRLGQVYYVFALAHAGRLEKARMQASDFSQWVDQRAQQNLARTDYSVMTRECYAAIAYYEGDRALAKEHAEFATRRSPTALIGNYLLGQLAFEEGDSSKAIEHWRICTKSAPMFRFLKERIAQLEAQSTR